MISLRFVFRNLLLIYYNESASIVRQINLMRNETIGQYMYLERQVSGKLYVETKSIINTTGNTFLEHRVRNFNNNHHQCFQATLSSAVKRPVEAMCKLL